MSLTGETANRIPPFLPDSPDEDLLSLGMRADRVRRTLHPGGVVTYTNTIHVACPPSAEDQVLRNLQDGVRRGATGAVLELLCIEDAIAAAESLLQTVRMRYPTLWLEMLIPSFGMYAAGKETALRRLRAAGLDSIACEPSAATDVMLSLHHAAHAAGMRTTAALPVVPWETSADRGVALSAIGRLQEETGGFCALRVTAPASAVAHLSEELTAVEYLRAVAVARLAVPNIPNIECTWRAQGLKLLQMTLRFGANDAGSSCIEQSIAHPGPNSPNEEDLRHVIRDAGFTPVERKPDYSASLLS